MKGNYQLKSNILCVGAAIASLTSTVEVAAQSSVLEEIVVTAQKRAESLQEVPIAVSAFTSEVLEQSGVTSTMDLTMVTPGLQVIRALGSPQFSLRGISAATVAAGNENSIATYVDGVYMPSMAGNNFAFNNLERVEVLKGPQGTLFGRNATGGLINVVTKTPSQESTGNVEVSYGNYETTGVNAYFSGGLTDTIAADLAVLYSDQNDRFGTNINTGNDRGFSKTQAIRSKVVFDASDATTVTFALGYSEYDTDMGLNRQLPAGALGIDGALAFGACLAGGGTQQQCAAVAVANATTFTGDTQNVSSDLDPEGFTDNLSTSLHIDHSFEAFDFLSTTSFQDTESNFPFDQDLTPVPLVDVNSFAIATDVFTQEFQFSSNSEGPLQWIAGVFYMDLSEGYDPLDLRGLAFAPAGLFALINNAVQETKSYSAFSQGTYDLTDATSLTVGLRYTRDEKELSVDRAGILLAAPDAGPVPLDSGTLDEEWSEPSWRIALDHQLNDSTLLYVSYNRGFKSGNFNLIEATSDPDAEVSLPVDPEIVDSYEIGVKTDLLDNTLRLNAAAYYYEYEDIQQLEARVGSAVLVNAAEAKAAGLETELLWLATENLTLTAGLSYIDSEYSSWPDADAYPPTGIGGNAGPIKFDASGTKLNRTPDLTYNLSLNYILPTATGEYAAQLTYLYNDGFNFEVSGQLQQESYDLINAELSWTSVDDNWRVRVYGKNLTDEEYATLGDISALGDNLAYDPPRTYGIGIQYRY